jgi:hypothetical protein
MDQKNLNELQKKSKSLSSYARYSSMAFQMIVILGLGVWGGIKIDDLLNLTFPLFTVILSLAAVLLALYNVLKDFLRMKNH